MKSGLDAFKIRYRQEVGLLHEELDELEHAIDEAERGERLTRPQPASLWILKILHMLRRWNVGA